MELTLFKIYISLCDKNEILNMDGSFNIKKAGMEHFAEFRSRQPDHIGVRSYDLLNGHNADPLLDTVSTCFIKGLVMLDIIINLIGR